MVQFIIITGLSGAGKSAAIKCFEDMGYFCIDNLPSNFISSLADLCLRPDSKLEKVALGIDVRGGEFFKNLFTELEQLKKKNVPYKILFLEASDEVLVRRFKETRRRHPLGLGTRIIDDIIKERELMIPLRGEADKVIDTTNLNVWELRREVRLAFSAIEEKKEVQINIISFGYKFGIPLDSDIVLDMRFLPNPNYLPELKDLTGEDERIRNFVVGNKEGKQFLKKIFDLLSFLLPHYVFEGKTFLEIAFGCTGGKHRAVVIAREVYQFLEKKGYNIYLRHRDLKFE